MKTSLLFFVLLLGLTGCTPFHMALTNEGRTFPALQKENVQLFFEGEAVPPSKEIANIVVKEDSETEGIEFMREQAAAIGADAITNVEVKIQTQVLVVVIFPIPLHTYFVSGTAVKYTN